ncbi:type IV-A pilus assembly ATPase PilB [Vreelandella nanhaiensis]|uniref:Type IV-A pilus assembly ATPase PilB n=1 Tax=Vreelandella nanhaiensis TaxID=1258546 RepID=A0A433KQA3_9GAMM|nr:type IV-A pilus assembly ATPase PilB [Halomonas nanhaiensis]RUR31799.1 type IV-A pilus assembly ATPase PilB [Halomonas nanhaiensis]
MNTQGLATRFVKLDLLTPEQVSDAQAAAKNLNISLLHYVVEHQWVSTISAASAAAKEYGLPLIDLEAIALDALPPASQFPARLLKSLNVLPLSYNGQHLTVAITCPSLLAQFQELKFAVDATRIEGVLAPMDQLTTTLNSYLAHGKYASLDHIQDITVSATAIDSDDLPLEENMQNVEDGPVVEFVNKVLMDAIDRSASDIHFEPYEHQYRIRFRIDGVLIEIAQPPLSMRNQIAARLKIMARLDISERRVPQDGAIKLKLSHDRSLDIRINSLPTVYGEKIVLRLLDPAAIQLSIDQLGLTNTQQALYEQALKQPQGMILVTGPTGSGKTVSLYTGITLLNKVERNICTAEDPVEIKVSGINQVNVLPKIGLDFANALRAFLRQDPDVIMVGEIRDLETAEIAVKAAQTGHLVLSTVHTNSAAQTLTRLSNIGVSPFNIASSVSLIIAQRLARKLCNYCKTTADIPFEALLNEGFSEHEIEQATLYRPVGCRKCTHGYQGRVGIYEVVPISEAMRQRIMHNESAIEIEQQARNEDHHSLRRSGLHYVLQGATSLEEINRVIKE